MAITQFDIGDLLKRVYREVSGATASVAQAVCNHDGTVVGTGAVIGALPAGNANIGDVDVATIAAGNTVIGKVRPALRMVSVSLTCAAAGDYAANDVISQSATDTVGTALTFASVVPANGEVAMLDRINAVCSEDSVLWRLRLHFYDYIPAAADVEMDDNIAFDFAKNATGAAGYLGYVDLPAMADRGTAMAHAQADNLRTLFKCGSSSTSLFVVPQTLDAEANETASMTLRLDFYFLD